MQKPFSRDELLGNIRTALKRDEVGRRRREQQQAVDSRRQLLTARECEVVELVASGMLSKQIARELGISERPVEAHRRHLIEKLELESLAELVVFAVQCGLYSDPDGSLGN